jgi:hypothetical protein
LVEVDLHVETLVTAVHPPGITQVGLEVEVVVSDGCVNAGRKT